MIGLGLPEADAPLRHHHSPSRAMAGAMAADMAAAASLAGRSRLARHGADPARGQLLLGDGAGGSGARDGAAAAGAGGAAGPGAVGADTPAGEVPGTLHAPLAFRVWLKPGTADSPARSCARATTLTSIPYHIIVPSLPHPQAPP
jgi:hypothetical protein